MAKKTGEPSREITERLQPAGSPRRGSYHLSAATAEPLRRKLRGRWMVVEHTLGGESYLARFVARSLKGLELLRAEYRAEYDFKDALCLKRVEISGALGEGEEETSYRYRLSVALSWDLDGNGSLTIRPELGYQSTEIGGEAAAVKELDDAGEDVLVAFRFEGSSLLLEEGDDRKVLERMP